MTHGLQRRLPCILVQGLHASKVHVRSEISLLTSLVAGQLRDDCQLVESLMLAVCSRRTFKALNKSFHLCVSAAETCTEPVLAASRSDPFQWQSFSSIRLNNRTQHHFQGVSAQLRRLTNSPQLQDSDSLTDREYSHLIDITLEDLYTKFEALLDEHVIEDADVELSDGVIKLALGEHGTYVLNKQAPNKQLWMSSPVSGPVRYDCRNGRWVYLRDGHDMHHRLTEELSRVFGPVQLDPDKT